MSPIPISSLYHHQSCDCTDTGFVGDVCELNINDCSFSQCQNGGICVDGFKTFTCLCPTHFTGNVCEIPIEEVCLNGNLQQSPLINGIKANFYNYDPTSIPSSIPKESNLQFLTPNLNYEWKTFSPLSGIQDDGFIGTFEAALNAPSTGLYNLTFTWDDGIIVYIAGVKVIDSWVAIENKIEKTMKLEDYYFDHNLYYDLYIEYFEKTGFATLKF